MRHDPESIGFSRVNLERLRKFLLSTHQEGHLMGAAVQVTRGGNAIEPFCVGRRRIEDEDAFVQDDTIFLMASITKPIVVAAFGSLIERGKVSLDDNVAELVPGFEIDGKSGVLIRHLMTHTSGLPDQIPENRSFRQEHRPLSDFVARICGLPLFFEPGTKVSYQSSGIAILGEIIGRITGKGLQDYLREIFFSPLNLKDTNLGIQTRSERESDVLMAGEGLTYGGSGTDFDWNSDYWRGFGAPWGGLLTTVEEMTRMMLLFRNDGELDGERCLNKHTIRSMLQDYTSELPYLNPTSEKYRRWGLGWCLGGHKSSDFGDLTSNRTFGHHGVTGTLVWYDPDVDVSCVILTNDPNNAEWIGPRISNMVMGSLL